MHLAVRMTSSGIILLKQGMWTVVDLIPSKILDRCSVAFLLSSPPPVATSFRGAVKMESAFLISGATSV